MGNRMFKKILIANRGEIAVRIMRTCQEMGIATVAVCSDADRHALHALEADEAVPIGPAEPSKSYLDIDRIVDAAKQTGAEAVHPGYGFLAENAAFAERCEREGIVFIGPPAQVIRSLGDKLTARRIMQAGGVPIIPGMIEAADAAENSAAWAAAAFGSGIIYLEKFLPKSRHVESQILADGHGRTLHLLERECSIQRRHQKIIEETPARP